MEASWTQWKNKFQFEILGEKGHLLIDGLGGSYGLERLVRWSRRPDPQKPGQYSGGAPDEVVEEFPGPDISWEREWEEFSEAIQTGQQPQGSGIDGLQANRVIDAVYQSARTGRAVPVR